MHPCPICGKVISAMKKHLLNLHKVVNKKERPLLLQLASGRVNIRRGTCPIIGCSVETLRLDRHIHQIHTELSIAERLHVMQQTKKRLIIQQLAELRKTHPAPPMVSSLDLDDAPFEKHKREAPSTSPIFICPNAECRALSKSQNEEIQRLQARVEESEDIIANLRGKIRRLQKRGNLPQRPPVPASRQEEERGDVSTEEEAPATQTPIKHKQTMDIRRTMIDTLRTDEQMQNPAGKRKQKETHPSAEGPKKKKKKKEEEEIPLSWTSEEEERMIKEEEEEIPLSRTSEEEERMIKEEEEEIPLSRTSEEEEKMIKEEEEEIPLSRTSEEEERMAKEEEEEIPISRTSEEEERMIHHHSSSPSPPAAATLTQKKIKLTSQNFMKSTKKVISPHEKFTDLRRVSMMVKRILTKRRISYDI